MTEEQNKPKKVRRKLLRKAMPSVFSRKNADTKWDKWYGGGWSGWGGYGSSTGGALTSFWRDQWVRGKENIFLPSGEIDEKVLARYLRETRNSVRIVFGGRISLNWASQDQNFTNIETGEIVLSPFPLFSKETEHSGHSMSQRLDVLHGTALHEAAHNRYTPNDIKLRTTDAGGELLSQLFNLMEDGYIEAEVMQDFPGFEGYFDAFPNFYFNETELKRRVELFEQTDFQPYDRNKPGSVAHAANQLASFVNVLIAACKTRKELSLEEAAKVSDRHAQAVKTIQEIVQYYRMCEVAGTSIEDRIDAAKMAYTKLCAYLEPQSEDEKQGSGGDGTTFVMGGNGEGSPQDFLGNQMPSAVRAAFASGGVNEAAGQSQIDEDAMTSGSGNSEHAKLGNDMAARINGLIDSNLREEEVETFHTSSDGDTKYKVNVVDMLPMAYATERYAKLRIDVRANTVRLKNKLRFRSSDVMYREREQLRGKVDPTRLPNLVAFKQKEIFERKIVTSAPSVHLGILVDESGSMNATTYGGRKSKDDVAVECCTMMVEAVKDMKGVSYEVWGHSGDSSSGSRRHGSGRRGEGVSVASRYQESESPIPGVAFGGPYCMRYLDSIQGLTDTRVLGRMTARHSNYDGLAIAVVAKNMVDNAPGRRKVMMVISDGMPAGFRWGNGVAETERLIKESRKKGVEVIGIFVGDLGSAKRQMDQMYGKQNSDWVHCQNADDLPAAMEKISRRILRWEREA